MPKNPRVFLDFTLGSKHQGRVTIELYTDLTPKTAENFRALCTGEFGPSKLSKKKLHYLGSKIHRIVDDFVIQGGDFINGDGSGGESIYGKYFADENFTRRHSHAGLLSMANIGGKAGSNSSQFFITLKPAPHLDGKHVVFGQVVDGMDIIRQIAKVPTDMYEKPRIPVIIVDCGEILDKNSIKHREQIEDSNNNAVKEYQKIRDEKQRRKLQQKEQIIEQQIDEEQKQQIQISDPIKERLEQKRLELQMKMNEARKMNNKAVLDENERLTDPTYEKRRNRQEFQNDRKQLEKTLEESGINKDKAYVLDQAHDAEKKYKKKGNNLTFGWDVFNEDALYRAYFKRIKKNNGKEEEGGDKVEAMAQDIEKQIEKRADFKRRRMFVDEKDVDFINDRNRVFNEKLERNFGKYAAETKANIETGNAL